MEIDKNDSFHHIWQFGLYARPDEFGYCSLTAPRLSPGNRNRGAKWRPTGSGWCDMRRTSTGCERREFLSGITEQMNAGIWRSPVLMESRWVIDRLSSCATKVLDNKTRGSPSLHPSRLRFKGIETTTLKLDYLPILKLISPKYGSGIWRKTTSLIQIVCDADEGLSDKTLRPYATERVLRLSGGGDVDPLDDTMPCETLV